MCLTISRCLYVSSTYLVERWSKKMRVVDNSVSVSSPGLLR